jgi:hypothetical protein
VWDVQGYAFSQPVVNGGLMIGMADAIQESIDIAYGKNFSENE